MFGNELVREALGDGKIQPFAIAGVILPLVVGAEVGDAGLHLDNGDLALTAERGEIGAAAVGQDEFRDRAIAHLPEQARRPAHQRLGVVDIRIGGGGNVGQVHGAKHVPYLFAAQACRGNGLTAPAVAGIRGP